MFSRMGCSLGPPPKNGKIQGPMKGGGSGEGLKLEVETYYLKKELVGEDGVRWRRGGGGGEGGVASWEGVAFDAGCVNAFLAAVLSLVMRASVPIPAVAAASVLRSAAVGGFVANDVGPL